MARAMVALYCASFRQVPRRITLDIDYTFDAVHGGQLLRLFNAYYDEYGFVVTNLAAGSARTTYEHLYCRRGQAETR